MKARFLAVATTVALLGVGGVAEKAEAALCANTSSCTLDFTESNASSGFGTGNFGTLGLSLVGNTVTVTITLLQNWTLVNTGFPNGSGATTTELRSPTASQARWFTATILRPSTVAALATSAFNLMATGISATPAHAQGAGQERG